MRSRAPMRLPMRIALLGWALSLSVFASDTGVPPAYSNIARVVGVPETILFAIAMQESLMPIGEGINAPWPWTLNVDGAPKRLANRQAMGRAIELAEQDGARFVDVGLMQINLHYNGHRFRTRDERLDPYVNIRVGAEILRAEREVCGNWWCAVGRYHSRTPDRAERYIQGVRRWYALIDQS